MNYPYQVDWKQEMMGKHIASTKRRVTFTFGFANQDAIASGDSGVACRGEEFTVVLSWSLTSGKRLVHCNGKQVHRSQGKSMETKFEAQWPIKGEHFVKIIAYSMASLVSTPRFRQFDLIVDGKSFFEMDKIFQLGGGNKNSKVERVVSMSSSFASQHTTDPHTHGIHKQGRSSGSLGGHSTSTIDSISPSIQQDFLDNYPVVHNNTPHIANDSFAPVSPELSSIYQASNQAIMNAYNKDTLAPATNTTAFRPLNNDRLYTSNAVASSGPAPYGGVPLAPRMPPREPIAVRSSHHVFFSQPNIQHPTSSLERTSHPATTFRPVTQWNAPLHGNADMRTNHTVVSAPPGSMVSVPLNQSSFHSYKAVNTHQIQY